ncbi:hypothetical protein RCL1_005299 [Eukaryota sp. TZLM3-RCL]
MFIGIEGGGTSTTCALVSTTGEILHVCSVDKSTNPLLVGAEAVVSIVSDLVQECLQVQTFSLPVKGLALTLSGVDNLEVQKLLSLAFSSASTKLADQIFFCNDSVGSSALLCKEVNMVLIAGTGSHCRVVLKDGRQFRSGGWGHLLGEFGCAYAIASRAITDVLRERDDHPDKSEFSTIKVRELLLTKFSLSDMPEILSMFYRAFDKAKIADLARDLAELAEQGDSYCCSLFKEAGRDLGRMVVAVLRQMRSAGLEPLSSLEILAIGSVWKSVHLFWNEFVSAVGVEHEGAITVYRPLVTAAVGAVVLQCNSQFGLELSFPPLVESFIST